MFLFFLNNVLRHGSFIRRIIFKVGENCFYSWFILILFIFFGAYTISCSKYLQFTTGNNLMNTDTTDVFVASPLNQIILNCIAFMDLNKISIAFSYKHARNR